MISKVYIASEGVNAQMAVPSNALKYFEAATRSLPIFADAILNIDHNVTREEYDRVKPFRS
jgi:predicted sulfurtransferase